VRPAVVTAEGPAHARPDLPHLSRVVPGAQPGRVRTLPVAQRAGERVPAVRPHRPVLAGLRRRQPRGGALSVQRRLPPDGDGDRQQHHRRVRAQGRLRAHDRPPRRGDGQRRRPIPEERLQAEYAQAYVDFIRLEPWYQFDFVAPLRQLWSDFRSRAPTCCGAGSGASRSAPSCSSRKATRG
jgi:hypothetical protein